MNIFEDLIEELKEDNLIEQTVIETNHQDAAAKSRASKPETPERLADSATPDAPAANEKMPEKSLDATSADKKNLKGTDFYRRKAMEEVAFLQMVEAAFAGVERDQMKMVPKSYDDLEVKKVLHSFLHVAPDAAATEHSQAEFQLLQATENWYSTLADRDRRMLTAHLRRYCESSRPPLSAPALLALARFYRNSAYSEQVRSKFDLMMTRIFSREIDDNKREVIFSRAELVEHIKELYAEWSSVPLYATENDDQGILQTAKQFEDFIRESDEANTFDDLINSNFFNRLRLFKESASEDFYAPFVAAVGIEANIHIGNRYVELLEKEEQTTGVAGVENKYGLSYDNTVSEATGKTVSLVELLKQKKVAPKPLEPSPISEPESKNVSKEVAAASPEKRNEKSVAASGSNRWIFVLLALLTAIVACGIYWIASAD